MSAAKQLSIFDLVDLSAADVEHIIEYGPIIYASEDGKTAYSVNGSFLNRWRRNLTNDRLAVRWENDDCRPMPQDLYETTVAKAMDLAEAWHKQEGGRVEPAPAPATCTPAVKSKKAAPGPATAPTSALTARQCELLANFKTDGNVARYQLDGHIDDWADVKAVFVELGAKWRTGKPGGFHFPADVDGAEKVRIALETGEIVDPKKANYFPTPEGLAERLVEMAGIKAGQRVLEPSAGRGAIAKAIVAHGALVLCHELLQDNVEALRAQGFNTQQGDFLAVEASPSFDACVMNPPFNVEGAGDQIDHVLHALDFVHPSGSLVSVMSQGVRYRDDAKHRAFRARVEAMGAEWTDVEAGAFKESGTMVATTILCIRGVRP